MKKVCVIGGGVWGTALGLLLAKKGLTVNIWAREKEVVRAINKKNENSLYLPGVRLPAGVRAFEEPGGALEGAELIVNGVPTQFIRRVFSSLKKNIGREVLLVSVSKGVETGTLKTPCSILKEILGREVCLLSGPSFAAEVAAEKPTAVTVSGRGKKERILIQKTFSAPYFRVYEHDDLIGAEIGGAVKNVIAIASGMCEGLDLGKNARAALITRGLNEMTRLGRKMGAKGITFSGLSGLGDLFLTCTSSLSRNYTVGFRLGRGEKIGRILSGMKSVAEGVETSLSAMKLSRKLGVEMPITRQVYLVLYRGKNPSAAVGELMARSLKPEFD